MFISIGFAAESVKPHWVWETVVDSVIAEGQRRAFGLVRDGLIVAVSHA